MGCTLEDLLAKHVYILFCFLGCPQVPICAYRSLCDMVWMHSTVESTAALKSTAWTAFWFSSSTNVRVWNFVWENINSSFYKSSLFCTKWNQLFFDFHFLSHLVLKNTVVLHSDCNPVNVIYTTGSNWNFTHLVK